MPSTARDSAGLPEEAVVAARLHDKPSPAPRVDPWGEFERDRDFKTLNAEGFWEQTFGASNARQHRITMCEKNFRGPGCVRLFA